MNATKDCSTRKRSADSVCDDQPAPKNRRTDTPARPFSDQFQNTLSKAPLTRRALCELDRRTRESATASVVRWVDARPLPRRLRDIGLDLSHLRDYCDQARMSQASSTGRKHSHASRSTSTSRGTTPYSGEYEQRLVDRGVYPKGYRAPDGSKPPKPGNYQEMRDVLGRPRPSLSPSAFSESAFEAFQDANQAATSEATAMASVMPFIAGAEDNKHEVAGDVLFNRLEKLHPEIADPKPDRYYGSKPETITTRVRDDLDKFIMPSNRTSFPVAPNFFLEVKSASGKPDVAQRQATHDAAVGARGMLELQNFGSTPKYDGNAYTMAATYHTGTGSLQMFATHPVEPDSGGALRYYINQLNAYSMTGNSESFRSGARAFRNARHLTTEQRDRFIDNANATARNMAADMGPSSRSSTHNSTLIIGQSPDSQTSINEPLDDTSTKRQRRHRGNT